MSTTLKLILAVAALAMVVTPAAIGAGEGDPIIGGERNPAANQTLELQQETEIIAAVNTYGTRQSNKSDNGGGAIYGCRSKAGGTPANNEPCIRSNNLNVGRAFEFETDGALAGTINAKGGDNARPFTTNATGVATGLNADRVDSKSADELTADALAAAQATEPFAEVAADGTSPKEGNVIASRDAVGDYTVSFAGDRRACAVLATPRGTDPNMVTTDGGTFANNRTTYDVRTFDENGAAEDSTFHISLNC